MVWPLLSEPLEPELEPLLFPLLPVLEPLEPEPLEPELLPLEPEPLPLEPDPPELPWLESLSLPDFTWFAAAFTGSLTYP